MTFEEYQEKARKTAIYPKEVGLAYVTLGLTGEAGEIANKVKKVFRDSNGELTGEARQSIAGEICDLMWYVSALCDELNISMNMLAEVGIQKLEDRQQRGTLHGSGDNR